MLLLNQIDTSWTLFLDRDGVINKDVENDYIKSWNEFKFYPTTLEALNLLSKKFAKIVIVTNQKGVGKGVMSLNDLTTIHKNMRIQIEAAGGRIDQIYFCSDLSDDSIDRKPNPGMAYQAKADFPSIEFSKSIIAGNRLSDMGFGKNAGMHTLFIASTHPETDFPHPLIDARFNNLLEFALELSY